MFGIDLFPGKLRFAPKKNDATCKMMFLFRKKTHVWCQWCGFQGQNIVQSS